MGHGSVSINTWILVLLILLSSQQIGSGKPETRRLTKKKNDIPQQLEEYSHESQQQQQGEKKGYIPQHTKPSTPEKGAMSGLDGYDQYQRVCSPVGLQTELCMTVRYPFSVPQEVPVEGPNFRHIDERFYQLTGLVIVDKDKLDPYRDLVATDDEIRKCLDETAELESDRVAIAVFTRRKKDENDFQFFGTQSEDQLLRVGKVFDPGHKFFLMGDSNIPIGIAHCTSTIFQTCVKAPRFPKEINTYCESPQHGRDLYASFESLDHSKVYITKFNLAGNIEPTKEKLDTNYTGRFIDDLTQLTNPNATSLQKFSILLQYPVAHVAREYNLVGNATDGSLNYNVLTEKLRYFVEGFMELQSPASKAAFAKIGWELSHVFVFDGLTQHFPSATGAYTEGGHDCKQGRKTCKAFENFNSDVHGPLDCMGPVPDGSLYRKHIEEERIAFKDYGFDMRWYGRTWDFTNLFFWQHKSWNGKNGMDCTHWDGDGGTCMYKYFLQAMIDEDLE